MDDDQRNRQNLYAALAVILLVVISVWALVAFKHSSDKLACEAAHHRDCDTLP